MTTVADFEPSADPRLGDGTPYRLHMRVEHEEMGAGRVMFIRPGPKDGPEHLAVVTWDSGVPAKPVALEELWEEQQ